MSSSAGSLNLFDIQSLFGNLTCERIIKTPDEIRREYDKVKVYHYDINPELSKLAKLEKDSSFYMYFPKGL